MNAYRLVPLLLCALFIGASSRKMPSAEDSNIDLEGRAQEHQRILAELEQVHQLRERMLQEAATYSGGSSGAPAPAPSYSTGTASTQYLTGEDTAGPAVAGTGGTPTTVSSVSGATANGGS